MSDLVFVTGNSLKFTIASSAFSSLGINLLQNDMPIDEIQSEDSEYIVRKKAEAAYAALSQPLVVSDDSWSILGLNGFPGSYMKSVTHWLSVTDWLNLTRPLADRRVELTQYVVYQDASGQRLFRNVIPGEVLREAEGDSGISVQSVITLAGDNGLSTAAALAKDVGHYNKRPATKIWQDCAGWYKENR